MHIENDTPFPVHIQRDYSTEGYALTAATTKVTYEVRGKELAFAKEQHPVHVDAHPLAPAGEVEFARDRHIVGVSVVGNIEREDGRPFASHDALLRIADRHWSLRAFGPRRWTGPANALEASEPEPVDHVPMEWSRAYGGKKQRPAGMIKGLNLPGPSSLQQWSENPEGQGFAGEPEDAIDLPLPQLENPDDPCIRWDHRPRSWCWAPVPSFSSLRMDHIGIDANGKLVNRHDPDELMYARARSNARPDMQLSGLAPGAEIALTGMGRPLEIVLPPPPFAWEVTAGGRVHRALPTLSSVLISTTERLLTLRYDTRAFAPLVRLETRRARQLFVPEVRRP